jgi:hypothetical protein
MILILFKLIKTLLKKIFQENLASNRNSSIFAAQNRGVEQLVARWAHNPKVTGSSPVPATLRQSFLRLPFFVYIPFSLFSN